ncbi:hypothetical protein FRB98_008717 [Tulasnella sp. 332]|nr:hypothetical protein FRB98_008717 [Tulasnella sp. 332]
MAPVVALYALPDNTLRHQAPRNARFAQMAKRLQVQDRHHKTNVADALQAKRVREACARHAHQVRFRKIQQQWELRAAVLAAPDGNRPRQVDPLPALTGFTSTPGGSCTASGSPPVPPSTCSETVSGGVATCPATTTIQPTHGLGKRKRSLTCMRGYQRCAQYAGLGGFECVDTANDPESCGGCVVPEGISQRDMDNGYDEASGQDCTAIPGVSATTCRRGKPALPQDSSRFAGLMGVTPSVEKCRKGFAKVRDANGQQYCKKSIQVNQSQNHWGSFP